MNDYHIRSALMCELLSRHARDPNTLILEELGLKHGAARVDIAIVNHILHGFEIKSDRDTLRRLPEQIRVYNSVLDRVTLIVGYRHAYEAMQIVPEWWGVTLAEMGPYGGVHFSDARAPHNNPGSDILAVAALLWRNEALEILEELQAADGVRSKPRAAIYKQLTKVAAPDLVRSKVYHQLRCRTAWRSDAQQASCGD